MTTTWLPPETTGSGVPLLCLPHSGAGAAAYREWTARLAPALRVLPVRLPGREQRFTEPLLTSVKEIVTELAPVVLALPPGPYRLFGHSMGALLAYELAQAASAAGRPPEHLYVSGFCAPQLAHTQPKLHELTDAQLVEYLKSLQGMDSELLDLPELLELMLPVVRADFTVCGTYQHPDHAPLEIPVTVFAGSEDSTLPAGSLEGWREASTGPVRLHTLPGGHFYLTEQLDAVARVITA
ncbi:alpha/beta fold hydrolase [Kutzneria viridogrisea]|uniref:Thioesterase domain-containing protein n=2 Tax=Kutzneria TaxID=43356 RepID=W5WMW7_9PSEU|nr:alpha/beta fold hydrolase [Kutzneria albida]AHH99519.1 hypothetical protein KALB_6159 [Kutzneria albida DSM 43870]MBA8922924.1 surfactin synthase thioesterase subunit [Kutzneria viridogrisea]